jgi:hypothetical protein
LHVPPFAAQLHERKNGIQDNGSQTINDNEEAMVNGSQKQVLLVGTGDRTVQPRIYR